MFLLTYITISIVPVHGAIQEMKGRVGGIERDIERDRDRQRQRETDRQTDRRLAMVRGEGFQE